MVFGYDGIRSFYRCTIPSPWVLLGRTAVLGRSVKAMSFDWNLSSDEEDLEEWTRKEGFSVGGRFAQSDGDKGNDGNDKVEEEKKDSWSSSPFASKHGNAGASEDESSQEEDEIDWEAGGEDDDNDDQDAKPPAAATLATSRAPRPVMIDLGRKQVENKEAKKPVANKQKRKNKYRLESLPVNVQRLLRNLHRSHVLTLTASAVHRSHLVSLDNTDNNASINNDDSARLLLAAAHSLLPRHWALRDDYESIATAPLAAAAAAASNSSQLHHYQTPTVPALRDFFAWYTDLIHNVEARRNRQLQANRAAGAPPLRSRRGGKRGRESSHDPQQDLEVWTEPQLSIQQVHSLLAFINYLSAAHDENPQLLSEATTNAQQENGSRTRQNQVLLLVAMARSMGWRTRYIQAMRPIQHDLDVDHPLVNSSSVSLFHTLSATGKGSTGRKKKAKRANSKVTIPATTKLDDDIFGWVEILCQDPKANTRKLRWVHVDPVHKLLDQPGHVEFRLAASDAALTPASDKRTKGRQRSSPKSSSRHVTLAYAIAVEHGAFQSPRYRLTDVTPRYADSWVASLRLRGVVRGKKRLHGAMTDDLKDAWWSESLDRINNAHRPDAGKTLSPALSKNSGVSQDDAIRLGDSDDEDKKMPAIQPVSLLDEIDHHENEELQQSASSEAIPTSKAAFKAHPLYVIASVLNLTEVLAPDASKRMCGVFKGELVYKRSDVSMMRPAKKWLYLGRKVLEPEMSKPTKRVKARKKTGGNGNFQALQSYGVGNINDGSDERRSQEIEKAERPLEDGMDNLYAIWQTEDWSPAPVRSGDTIPVNEYKNIELELMNPGLVHIDQRGVAGVAKKLGLPYAPCLLGFEGHQGNRTPTIRGIVVHQHNEQLIREANVEVTSHAIENENENRRKAIYHKWKRLLVGLLTKDRVEREYG